MMTTENSCYRIPVVLQPNSFPDIFPLIGELQVGATTAGRFIKNIKRRLSKRQKLSCNDLCEIEQVAAQIRYAKLAEQHNIYMYQIHL